MTAILLSINTSNGGVPKLPRHQAQVTRDGVEGDRQRDLRHHGGPDRAVCLYSFDRIRALQAEGHPVSVGLTGENLTVAGVDWSLVTPGTRLTIGGVRLLVTAFAVPCRNLTSCVDAGQIGRVSQKTHPGWSRVYARVEQPGPVNIGDAVTLEGPDQHWPASPTSGTTAGAPTDHLSIRRIGTLDIACPPAQAFVYFTPDGERLWVPGWEPAYLHPLSGEQEPGAIFTTVHGGEDTLWMVLRLAPAEGIAEYARVTPGSRRGLVNVSLAATGHDTTRATVSYDLTSVSPAGDEVLGAMTEAAYGEMLADWQRMIADCRR